jgi:hypothetical protein
MFRRHVHLSLQKIDCHPEVSDTARTNFAKNMTLRLKKLSVLPVLSFHKKMRTGKPHKIDAFTLHGMFLVYANSTYVSLQSGYLNAPSAHIITI